MPDELGLGNNSCSRRWPCYSKPAKQADKLQIRLLSQVGPKLSGDQSATGRIAGAGFQVLGEGRKHSSQMLDGDIQSILERSLRQQISKERKILERGLALLASIGSTAPFVGLFGTVWGIMNALQGISRAKSASLDVVAGPIGEALIATVIGKPPCSPTTTSSAG